LKTSRRLKFFERNLSIWIILAMIAGVTIGYFNPVIPAILTQYSSGTTIIPLALGLILMMYPPLAKVRYDKLNTIFSNMKLFYTTMFVTWIVGPALMFLLAWIFLHNYPQYFSGLVLIGIAPCIAMVLVWSELAGGNREFVAGLVAINSLIQVFFFSVYAWFFLNIIPPLFGMKEMEFAVSIGEIAKTVGIYLGIPFAAGLLSRYLLTIKYGADWYERKFIPFISPVTPFALLATIIMMFSLKGHLMIQLPGEVARIALPLVIFFLVMFYLMYYLARKTGADYPSTASAAFTASGNNFELAIAVSIGVFGIHSGQAFAGVIGPLVEVPVLLSLVNAALKMKEKYFVKVIQ
jgi:arsenite transporter